MNNCKSILIVEDDEAIRQSLTDVLEAEGYKVLTASNGQEALTLLTEIEKPALIFLDIMMPIMDGHQFLKLLRDDVALAPIPVIVTSASTQHVDVKGANSFLRKPLELESILKVAEQHCGFFE